MRNQFLCLDVETTGLAATDAIVEIAWRLIDDEFNMLDEGSSLIDPLRPIPSVTSAVHGITNRDVVDAPTADEYFGGVLDNKLGNGDFILVCHNVAFDSKFVSRFLPEGTPEMCTLNLARQLYPNAPNHKLATLVYELELEVNKDRFHSAEGDMDVLESLLGKMCTDFGYTLYDLFVLSNTKVEMTPESKIGFGKHRGEMLKDLPSGYRNWLLKLDNLDPEIRGVLQKL